MNTKKAIQEYRQRRNDRMAILAYRERRQSRLDSKNQSDPIDIFGARDTIMSQVHNDGGPGSGNFGHAGRPGKRGGSASGANQPRLVGQIDASDRSAIDDKLEQFRNFVIHSNVERAMVITNSGNVYEIVGTDDRVEIESLADALNGAIVSHNHPEDATEYSFSHDDFDLFQKYQLLELYGFDKRYSYSLKRVGISPQIESKSLEDMDEEQFMHQMIYERAKKEGVYYERKEYAE